jgi:hypothetical protein
VQANPNYKAIPSTGSATQTFFDTFDQNQAGSVVQTSRNDNFNDIGGQIGKMEYTINAGTPKAWEIKYRGANNRDSMPFISSDHFMDMLFDGATPGTSASTHTIYGTMAMTPVQTIDISGGRIAHLTMEFDGHQSLRRWMDFNLAPASDPLIGWVPGTFPVNNTGRAIFMEIYDGMRGCFLSAYHGTVSATNKNVVGGQVPGWSCGGDKMYIPKNFTQNGLGLDNKSRYDFFISQTHAAFFQDGVLIAQADIPSNMFSWANEPLKAYFTHYLYHSTNDIDELMHFGVNGSYLCYPMNSYWFNHPTQGTSAGATPCNTAYPPGYGFRNSDERHWDNMGFEVLPASIAPANNFASLASLVQLPAYGPVTYATGTNPTPLPPPPPPPVNPPPPPPPAASCPTTIPSETFLGCYYNNADLTGYVLSRNDNAINFNWGTGSPDPSIGADTFSVKWEGDFTFAAGNYNFTATTDDGVRLYMDGLLMTNQWIDQAPTSNSHTMSMTAGVHRIRMDYYDNGAGAVAQLSWVQQGATTPNPTPPPTGTLIYNNTNGTLVNGWTDCSSTNPLEYTHYDMTGMQGFSTFTMHSGTWPNGWLGFCHSGLNTSSYVNLDFYVLSGSENAGMANDPNIVFRTAAGQTVSRPLTQYLQGGGTRLDLNQWERIIIPISSLGLVNPTVDRIQFSGVGTSNDMYIMFLDEIKFTSASTTSTLTVAKAGTGSGTVSGTGISCGSDCSETVSSGTGVTLTAAPASGSTFAGWSGGGCSGTSTCAVTVSSATTVTATFNSTSMTTAKTVTIDLEGRSSDAVSGSLEVLNSSKAMIRTYPFTTSSSGTVNLNLDNTSGQLFFKVKAAPFLTRLLSGDLSTPLTFSQLRTGDINQDNIVNSIDFSTLNQNWFTSSPSPDLNVDGIVNSLDFSLMNRNWFVRGEE